MNLPPLDEQYWTDRYHQHETGWDVGYPTPPLVQIIDRLENPDTRILIPGAGNAWEAEYAWEAGFDHVYVLDISLAALQNFQRRMPDFPSEQLIHADFFQFQGQFDVILEQTFFCAIHPQLRAQYARHMHALLAPGGVLTGVLFNDPLNADKPPFGGNTLEYLGYFNGLFSELSITACKNSIPPRAGREVVLRAVK
jgi:thiopurine S-methyltransferase